MKDAELVAPPSGKVTKNFSIRRITRQVIANHAHIHYDGNDSMALDYIVQEWNELRAAKEQGRIKVLNP